MLTVILLLLASSFSVAISKPAHPDTKRTRQIQAALVRTGYLHRVTGQWDLATEDALRRLQHDNGWQGKVIPDARAIIFLNLGPDYSRVLNPETAWLPSVTVQSRGLDAQASQKLGQSYFSDLASFLQTPPMPQTWSFIREESLPKQ